MKSITIMLGVVGIISAFTLIPDKQLQYTEILFADPEFTKIPLSPIEKKVILPVKAAEIPKSSTTKLVNNIVIVSKKDTSDLLVDITNLQNR